MKYSNLHVFLPVHNRGNLTANFIRHFLRLIDPNSPCQFWILDDGCTDNTIELALKQIPGAAIIKLSGSAYWGGALNAIRKIIVNRHVEGFRYEHYLVCNDDIRFPLDSLSIAMNSVSDSNVVCALPEMIDHNILLGDQIPHRASSRFKPMHRFDPICAQFVVEYNPLKVDTASTYAMLTTSDPWIASEPIPSSIPHYLSDWWLTYSFSKLGFAIVHPPGFDCFTSTLTTKNRVNVSALRHDLVFPYFKFRNWLKYARESVNPKSPSYAPAWITFLKRYSNTPILWIVLLRYRVAFFVGSSLNKLESFVQLKKTSCPCFLV
jgi:glycosyltransferase involved in cell wall biosynthesis